MNILFTCVGRRKYLIDYFRAELSAQDKIVGVDLSLSAPALAACDKIFQVPSVFAEDYIKQLLAICEREKIDALLSLNDLELPLLAKNRNQFAALGTMVVLGDERVVDVCADKWQTIKFAQQNGIPVPATFLQPLDALEALTAGKVQFPLIVKPRWGSASFGLQIVHNEADLIAGFESCKANLSDSYLADCASSENTVIIQSFIGGPEFGVDIFNDLNGQYRGVVCKQKLAMRAGETDKAITVSSDRFAEYAQRIAESLGHMGNLDCDFLQQGEELFLLEMNPRFGGGYPFSHEAGANLARALLLALNGREHEIEIDYKVGVAFAKCDTLVAVNNEL